MIDQHVKYAISIVLAAFIFFLIGLKIGSIGDDKPLSKSEYIKQAKTEPPPAPVHKLGYPEVAPPGWIRTIHYEQRSFIYESDYGFIKVFSPLCGSGLLPIWPGMRVTQINYRWAVDVNSMSGGCYALDYVGHDPKGDYQTK